MLRLASRLQPPPRGRILLLGSFYLATMAGLLALAAHGAGRLATFAFELRPKSVAQIPPTSHPAERAALAPIQKAAMSLPQTHIPGSVTLTQDWWGGSRGSGSWRERQSWDSRRDRSSRERSRGWDWGFGWDSDDEEERPQSRSTYRTLCVRLCDGFYWPISFATTAEHFDRDRRKCESSCGSPARLYTYRNPGGNLEDMQDLNGKPYSRLNTAFAYRTDYNESCKCRSDPWQQEAMDRHRVYALEAAKKEGDKLAAQQLRELKATASQAGNPQPAGGAPTANASSAVEPSDEASAQDVEQKTAARPPPSRHERMSLGARSGGSAAKSSAPMAKIWRNTAESAP